MKRAVLAGFSGLYALLFLAHCLGDEVPLTIVGTSDAHTIARQMRTDLAQVADASARSDAWMPAESRPWWPICCHRPPEPSRLVPTLS